MWLIVGLGNPGSAYQDNRHNVGFMAVDSIAHRHNFLGFGKKFGSYAAEGMIAGQKTLLLKPLSYMNLSGGPVAEAARFFKIPPQQVIVIHDELDVQPAKLKVKNGGGHGGHNGLKSIDAHLGQEYWRVRIGIGHPGDKDRVADYVLHDFGVGERKQIDTLLDIVAQHIDMLVAGDDNGFTTKVALLTAPPKPPKEKIEKKKEPENGI